MRSNHNPSFALDYLAVDGEQPSAAEQAATKMALPGVLEALAKLENQMRRQPWGIAMARRSLARTVRAGQEDTNQGGHHANSRS